MESLSAAARLYALAGAHLAAALPRTRLAPARLRALRTRTPRAPPLDAHAPPRTPHRAAASAPLHAPRACAHSHIMVVVCVSSAQHSCARRMPRVVDGGDVNVDRFGVLSFRTARACLLLRSAARAPHGSSVLSRAARARISCTSCASQHFFARTHLPPHCCTPFVRLLLPLSRALRMAHARARCAPLHFLHCSCIVFACSSCLRMGDQVVVVVVVSGFVME